MFSESQEGGPRFNHDSSNLTFSPSSPTPIFSSPSMNEDQHKEYRPHTSISAQSTAVASSSNHANGGPKPRHNARGSTLRERAQEMLKPQKKILDEPTVLRSIWNFWTSSWLNVLLVFIPISWVLHFVLHEDDSHRKDIAVFVTSFIAIIPLAKLLGFATEELSLRVGQTLAGLLNATLGNAVELIVAIIALVKCELRVVQASLVGSILSNLLLVLGMCFFAGGMRFSEQGFGASATQLNSSLLTVSVIAVLLPAAFHFSVPDLDDATEALDILAVSHGVSIILLVIYIGYLIFQLFSHANLYEDSGDHIFRSTDYHADKKDQVKRIGRAVGNAMRFKKEKAPSASSPMDETKPRSLPDLEEGTEGEEEEEHETPCMNLWVSIGSLIVTTVLVAVTAEWLVDSIDGITSTGKISKEFVGMILLPIVGNAAEHLTAVTVSVKDKLTLSLGVAVGSSIQIALFVIPFVITLGWILGKPLTLLFDPYESVALFLSVLTVNYVVQDGKSNWLEGFILVCLYVILAVTFWYYPGSDPSGVLTKCT